jgi:DNA invertase Pin-like site-specific DNA recombinase
MKVALYARVSSQRQEKRGTIASQVEALRHYARDHHYSIAENYVKLAERYRRGKLYRARQGEVFWASISYGYRRRPRQGSVPASLVIYEPEAEVVRKIFHWHAYEGMSIRQIVKRLTREGHTTPKGGRRWAESTVHKIVRQEAYLGTLYYNRSYEGNSNLT